MTSDFLLRAAVVVVPPPALNYPLQSAVLLLFLWLKFILPSPFLFILMPSSKMEYFLKLFVVGEYM